jgi:cytochrome c biogenesis protein CcmG, thiol:disulfide interchange protein DsbE
MALAAGGGMKGRWILWVPLVAVLALGVLFAWGLTREPSAPIASQWIDRPMPPFDLPRATEGVQGFSTRGETGGTPRLVNLFASWCIPCRAEAPQLDALARAGVQIDGVAIRDRPEDVALFLEMTGNPYARIGADPRSELMIAMGSAGVPETFIVDGNGVVRRQIQGVITDAMVPQIIAEMRALGR